MKLTINPFQHCDLARLTLPDDADRARMELIILQQAAVGTAFTVTRPSDGAVMLIGGLYEQAPHHATAWSVISPARGLSSMATITRATRTLIAKAEYRRVDCLVEASNDAARRWASRIGFGPKPEARLRAAAPDGGDVLVYAIVRGVQ